MGHNPHFSNLHNVASSAGRVATPTASKATPTGLSSNTITLACATTGATIRYTTDGTTPTWTHGTLYTAPFAVLPAVASVKAVAYLAQHTLSAMLTSAMAWYDDTAPTVTPDPAAGYNGEQAFAFNTADVQKTYRYTTDGSAPAVGSTAITLPDNITLTLSSVDITIKIRKYAAGSGQLGTIYTYVVVYEAP
jgi:hypothetical protein